MDTSHHTSKDELNKVASQEYTDASLIAAAPDLYAAVERLLKESVVRPTEDGKISMVLEKGSMIMEQLYSALKKAEGRG